MTKSNLVLVAISVAKMLAKKLILEAREFLHVVFPGELTPCGQRLCMQCQRLFVAVGSHRDIAYHFVITAVRRIADTPSWLHSVVVGIPLGTVGNISNSVFELIELIDMDPRSDTMQAANMFGRMKQTQDILTCCISQLNCCRQFANAIKQ